MSRIRAIKPGFFLNEDLAVLPPLTRLLFIGLWTLADREGRLEERPRRIKAEILPYDDCDVPAMLDELADTKFITRYTAQGLVCIAIPKFAEHQRPHPSEIGSALPAPIEHNAPSGVPNNCCTEVQHAQEGKGREGNRKGKEQEGKENMVALATMPTTALVASSQEPQNLFEQMLGAFCALWQARYGQRYKSTPADKAQFGRLLKDLDPEQAKELPARWKRYLLDEDQFVAQKMRHSLVHFCTQGGFNKYGVEVLVMSGREATAAAAERQWIGLHGGGHARR